VCAGTYGHYLLNVDHKKSREITCKIDSGDLSEKPGWVRLSLHPTMTDEELDLIADALRIIEKEHKNWEPDYVYNKHTNEFTNPFEDKTLPLIHHWFDFTKK
jgi:hypothetical protein